MKYRPYVGISGITSTYNSSALLNNFPEKATHLLGLCVPIKVDSSIKDVKKVFINDSRVCNIISPIIDKSKPLLQPILMSCGKLDGVIDAIQLELEVGQIGVLEQLRQIMEGHLRIIFEVKIADMSFLQAHDLIRRVEPFVDDILIDLSLGTGIPLSTANIKNMASFLHFLRLSCPDLGIGFSGVSTGSVKLLKPVLKEIRPINIDSRVGLTDGEMFITACLNLFQEK